MKVLHLINTLSAGGAELHLLTLCKHLRQFGVDSQVAYLKEVKGSRLLKKDFESTGIEVFHLKGEGTKIILPSFQLRRFLKVGRTDILHTHLPRADLVGFIAKINGFSGSWVTSVHDIYSKSWRGSTILPLLGFVWRRSQQIVAISKAVKDWLIEKFKIPPNKIQLVYYGIEPFENVFTFKDLRSTWNLGDNRLILSIGRIEPTKGHELLIRAMALIIKRFPQARLLIAGHDPWEYGNVLRSLVRKMELDQYVRFLGFQSDIPSLLHASDVFALASRSEGFGQVVIEAMAAAKPVVVSKIPPLTEIVYHKDTGLWAEVGNPESFAEKIIFLLSNPEEARAMGQRAKEKVHTKFSASRMAKEILNVYEQCLESAP